MSVDRLAPRFVEDVPEVLEPGFIYISIEHATMAHLCACGCVSEVVLPLSPVDWRFTWNGEQISVAPSVGSWSLPCRSHYIITGGRVRWADDWSDEDVAAGRSRDRRIKQQRYYADPVAEPPVPAAAVAYDVPAGERSRGLLSWLRRIARRQ